MLAIPPLRFAGLVDLARANFERRNPITDGATRGNWILTGLCQSAKFVGFVACFRQRHR